MGVLGFDSRRGLEIFLFTTASRTALGPTQHPIQWVTGALSLWVKRPGREAGHSHQSSTEVKECVEVYLHYTNIPSWCAQLKKSIGSTLPLPFTVNIYNKQSRTVDKGWSYLLGGVRGTLRPLAVNIKHVPKFHIGPRI
jgi:hypothetical protein